MAGVFISYVHEDQKLAESIAVFLREKGIEDVFFTGDDWLLYAGEVWLSRIRKELNDAKVLLCLFSPRSTESEWIHFEAGAAWLTDKVVIPVCVGGLTVSDLRIPYSGMQSITLVDPSSAYYLLRSIWNYLKPEKPAQMDDVVPPMPFPPNDEGWQKLELELKNARKTENA